MFLQVSCGRQAADHGRLAACAPRNLIACEIVRFTQNDAVLWDRMFRTHDCNSLRKSDIGKQVTLAGWVNVTRDHGGVIFIDLRDREGLTQIVFRPEENAELAKEAHTLGSEDVIDVSGRVAARLPGTENPNLATGDIEIIPSRLRILNRADTLPFPLDAEPQNEDLRMTHRYFDLRRPRLAHNLRVRHRVAKATRDRKSTRLNSSHYQPSRMPSSA